MSNFIGLVYATLKSKGIDYSNMSTDEAVAKFNELNKSGGVSREKKAEAVAKFKGEKNKQPNAPAKEKTLAQTVKGELKDAGIDTKAISVKQSRGGYSDAVNITINDPNVDIDKVRKIAEKHEDYERDERTGEILSGGNTYVFVEYDDSAFNEVSKPYIKQGEQLLNELNKKRYSDNIDNTVTVEGVGRGVFMYPDGKSTLFAVQNDKQHTRRRVFNSIEVAKYIYQLKKFGKVM